MRGKAVGGMPTRREGSGEAGTPVARIDDLSSACPQKVHRINEENTNTL